MNNRLNKLDCTFHSGSEDYVFSGPHNELKLTASEQATTVITTYVLMTSGCYIDGGFVTLNNNDVTLIYTSWDNGTISFEQYSCEITFAIATASLPLKPKYTLVNNHESRTSDDEFLSL